MPRQNKFYEYDEATGASMQIEEGFGCLHITLLDFERVGISVRVTVRKNTAVKTLKGFLLSLPETEDIFTGMLEKWIGENKVPVPKSKLTLKQRLAK